MSEEKYFSYFKDKELKSAIKPLYDFFETYISKDDSETEDKKQKEGELEQYVTALEKSDILNHVLKLRRLTKQYLTLQPFILSLQINIQQFRSKNRERSLVKWKKILLSYINVSRILLNVDDIEKILSNVSSKKLIVALGTIDIKKDNIKVNEEIEKVWDTFKDSDNYTVLAIFGCTINIFSIVLKMFPRISILHLAGHGLKQQNTGEISLPFVNSDIKFNKFNDYISRHQFMLVFLNACYSLKFSNNGKITQSVYSILHKGQIGPNTAVDFSYHFYSYFEYSNNIQKSFSNAKNGSNNCSSYYLLP